MNFEKEGKKMTQKRAIVSYKTFLRRTKASSPTKQVTKRKLSIQPIPGSLGLSRVFPSVLTRACSYVFLFKPNKYDPNPPSVHVQKR